MYTSFYGRTMLRAYSNTIEDGYNEIQKYNYPQNSTLFNRNGLDVCFRSYFNAEGLYPISTIVAPDLSNPMIPRFVGYFVSGPIGSGQPRPAV